MVFGHKTCSDAAGPIQDPPKNKVWKVKNAKLNGVISSEIPGFGPFQHNRDHMGEPRPVDQGPSNDKDVITSASPSTTMVHKGSKDNDEAAVSHDENTIGFLVDKGSLGLQRCSPAKNIGNQFSILMIDETDSANSDVPIICPDNVALVEEGEILLPTEDEFVAGMLHVMPSSSTVVSSAKKKGRSKGKGGGNQGKAQGT